MTKDPEATRSPNQANSSNTIIRDALGSIFRRGSEAWPGDRSEERPYDPSFPAAQCPPSSEAGEPLDSRAILEALLFVGNEDNRPLSAREAAATIGGLTPGEIQSHVDRLNATYTQEGAAYTIVREPGGFRLVLREEFERVRRRFHSRVREARLSRSAVEVLAIVAYCQPLRVEEVDAIRGTKNGAVLAQLVRRQLLAIDRQPDAPRRPLYRTTERFLRLYGLNSLEDLPRVEQLSAAQ